MRRFCHRHDRQRSESRIRGHACPARAEWSANRRIPQGMQSSRGRGERVSNRSVEGIVTSALFTCQTRRASVGSDEQNQQSVGQVAGLKLLKKVPILGERGNARRLRRWRERTIDSAAPVDPFEELIHVACEAQEHVVLSSSLSVRRQRLCLRPKPDDRVPKARSTRLCCEPLGHSIVVGKSVERQS